MNWKPPGGVWLVTLKFNDREPLEWRGEAANIQEASNRAMQHFNENGGISVDGHTTIQVEIGR